MPFEFEEHVRLMYDLMVLAYQANITRVITFMMGREVSNRTYTQVGVTDGHHAVSHHQNKAEKIEHAVAHPDVPHRAVRRVRGAKLHAIPDGDGSLLDNSDAAVRQQHEQQQRARSLPAAEHARRRRPRPAQGRPSPAWPTITRR